MTQLALEQITKRFRSSLALDGVSFDVAPGEVHALLGENGAGKSTLMHIAYGMIQPDAGTIRVDGVSRRMPSPRSARAAGIGMVHQHFTSVPALSVAENIALAAGWSETGRRAERRAATVIERLALPLDASAMVGSLSVQLRQRLEVVKALASDATVLLLDEPSAVLAPREVRELLATVRHFADSGGAVVLITHKLDEVFVAADRVTVLRRGEVTLAAPLAGQTHDSLARAMLGSELVRETRNGVVSGEVLVCAEEVVVDGGSPISFEVRAGEIVGIAAIEGNGQREILRSVAGVAEQSPSRGTLSVATPIAFIPEDRTVEGVITPFTLTENLLLGINDRVGVWIDWPAMRTRAATLMQEYDIRAEGVDATAGSLSGGNQQKLVFARALERAPRVLVAEDPTRGLDILASQAIHTRLRDAAAQGVAVLIHSSDLDEVLDLSDRVLVVANRQLREMPTGATRDEVGDAMLGITAA